MGALPQAKPRDLLPSLDALQRLFEVREIRMGRGLFACQPIARGTLLFSEDDWVDEAEARAFSVLPAAQIDKLSPALRSAFLRYGYNTALDEVTGTFHPEAVRHPVNFINHSCEPNLGYDGVDAIIALRAHLARRRNPHGLRDLQLFLRSRVHLHLRRLGLPRAGAARRLERPGAGRPAPARLHARAGGPHSLGLGEPRRSCHH